MDYIRRLLRAIERQWANAQVTLLVSTDAASHPNCQRLAGEFGDLITLQIAPRVMRRNRFLRLLDPYFERQWQNAESFYRAFADIGRDAVDYVVIPHMESVGLLQLGLRRNLFRGTPWATIAVGVRFHHRKAGIHGPTRWIDRMQQVFFWRVLRDRALACFGSIDPFFAPAVRYPKVAYCPDPCEPPALASPAEARAAYGVRAETCVVLVFGFIDARKCLDVLFEGAARVGPDIDLTILIAGPQHGPQVSPALNSDAAQKLRGLGRLVEVNRFILSGQDIDPMSATDIAWVFYRPQFVYSSSVLVRSAMSGRAAIVRRQGVIGRQVHEHQCGLALESDAPEGDRGRVDPACERCRTSPQDG